MCQCKCVSAWRELQWGPVTVTPQASSCFQPGQPTRIAVLIHTLHTLLTLKLNQHCPPPHPKASPQVSIQLVGWPGVLLLLPHSHHHHRLLLLLPEGHLVAEPKLSALTQQLDQPLTLCGCERWGCWCWKWCGCGGE